MASIFTPQYTGYYPPTQRGTFTPRGGYSPRRGSFNTPRGGRASPFRCRPSREGIPGRDILEGLVHQPLRTIRRDNRIYTSDITLENLEYLGSYNWIEAKEPTIVVPGSPRKWLDKQTPYTVEPDTGKSFIDQNGYRMSSYPLVPMFRAVDIMENERNAGSKQTTAFDWASVDIVTDRNSLRKILGWAQGEDVTFRIDIQLAGERTMLLHRWESHQAENAEGTGWANNFEYDSTEPGPGCERGTLVGHHRVVSYDFAGLKFVVRSEVDAYNPALCELTEGSAAAKAAEVPANKDDDVKAADSTTAADRVAAPSASDPLDELTNALGSLTVDPTTARTTAASTTTPTLHIIRAGQVVPQKALIKLKTRNKFSVANFDWHNAYPQLFLGGCPTLHIGVHKRGTFYEVRKKHLDDADLRGVARDAQSALKRLREALGEVHNFAMANGKEARRSLVCRGGNLQVMQRESADSFLPDDILRRFDA